MNTTDMLITLITSIIENMTLLGVMFYLTHVSIANIRTSKKSLGLITLSLSIMYLIQQFNNSQIQFGLYTIRCCYPTDLRYANETCYDIYSLFLPATVSFSGTRNSCCIIIKPEL